MAAKPLTKAEKAWLDKLQSVLKECPSKRLAAYTIGDAGITIYDSKFDDAIHRLLDNSSTDFGPAADSLGVTLAQIVMPFPVHGTAG